MKTFRLIGMMALAIVMSMSFTSCGDDENDEAEVEFTATLIGVWSSSTGVYEFGSNGDAQIYSSVADYEKGSSIVSGYGWKYYSEENILTVGPASGSINLRELMEPVTVKKNEIVFKCYQNPLNRSGELPDGLITDNTAYYLATFTRIK